MKLKLLEILNCKDVLIGFSGRIFSAKTSYKIQKNIKELSLEWAEFDKIKIKMFEKYGYKISDKGEEVIKILPENLDVYTKELNELLSEEIDINIMTIDLEDLNFNISPVDMMNIDWMINSISV